jgi:pyruvate, orthophosphate dikinase
MPEVMIPLVAHVHEFRRQALIVRQVAEEVFRERQITVPYLLGTMIELPRAALTADEIAREAQFFSFGTNDLTQTTWGLSRDDPAGSCPLPRQGHHRRRPVPGARRGGVGKLMAWRSSSAARRGRSQAGHLRRARRRTRSIAFCEAQRMNYVSCSPFRVPIARLAAAQAALAERGTMMRTRATV